MDYSMEAKTEECWPCAHGRSEWAVQALEHRGYLAALEHYHDPATDAQWFARMPQGCPTERVGAQNWADLKTLYEAAIDRWLAARG